MKTTALMMLIPDALTPSLAVLCIVVAGFAIMVGARRAATLLFLSAATLLVLPFMAPAIDELVGELLAALPWYVSVTVLAGLGVYLLRAMLALPLGQRGADYVVAALVLDGIRGVLRLAFVLIGALARGIARIGR